MAFRSCTQNRAASAIDSSTGLAAARRGLGRDAHHFGVADHLRRDEVALADTPTLGGQQHRRRGVVHPDRLGFRLGLEGDPFPLLGWLVDALVEPLLQTLRGF